MADAHNVLTAIEQAEENDPATIEAATNAFNEAWCDGPPYAHAPALESAKKYLVELGTPDPDLPPLNESRFEPQPDVEIDPGIDNKV